MSLLIKLLCLSMVLRSSVQQSTVDSPTYVAGVVEFAVYRTGTATESFKRNADEYVTIMSSSDAERVDIIVFPEGTLNTVASAVIVPSPTEDVDLCNNATYDENLRTIACGARDRRKYVVVNLTMKRNCTEEHDHDHDHEHDVRHHDEDHEECESEWIYYNTNVVFNRDGKVVSVYRKVNLFGETGITVPSTVDDSTFTTDFGVKFGHFICFDLMFDTPALDLIEQGVKNIIFPTMWFSELPFLSAVQAQQNWAHSNDVNFLGAGANRPAVGSTGSGIYSGRLGALTSLMTGENTTRLLVHEVDKIPGTPVASTSPAYSGASYGSLFLKRDQLDAYSYRDIGLPESGESSLTHTFTLCHTFREELCCDFEIDVARRSAQENTVSYTYKAAVFNGIRTFDGFADGGIRTCAIIACRDSNVLTCGTLFESGSTVDSNVEFRSIKISGVFSAEKALNIPSSLNFNIDPYPTTDFTYKETIIQELPPSGIPTSNITISLTTAKTDLFTFAIYARAFDYTNSAATFASTILVWFVAVAAVVRMNF